MAYFESNKENTAIGDIVRCSINHIGSSYNASTISSSIAAAFPESGGSKTFVGTYNYGGQGFITGYIYYSNGNPYINAFLSSFGRCQYVYCMGNISSAVLKNITTTNA